MHALVTSGILVICAALPAAAQTTCSPEQTRAAVDAASALHRKLATVPVSKPLSAIPDALGQELVTWKDALTEAVRHTLACTSATLSPEQIQVQLAQQLHANLPTEAPGKEEGAYASGLTVQVFELFGKPRILEVDLRYGIECGDDHLLLIFQTPGSSSSGIWQQQLRWDTKQYHTVADALGDFVLLAPLTGSHEHPNWRYLVAHGHPSCEDTPHVSTFDLDLLRPATDPARPGVDWHFERPYTAGEVSPRLATTEDTIDFRLNSPSLNAPRADNASVVFRFRLSGKGSVEPAPATAPAPVGEAPSTAPATH